MFLTSATCLGLAFEAMREGQSAPVVLNAANEIAVEAFLEERIRFDQIPNVVGQVLENSERIPIQCLDDVLKIDKQTRVQAAEMIKKRL